MYASSNWVHVDRFASCKHCGAKDVAWQQSKSGKWYLVDARRRADGILEADRTGFHECHTSYTPPPSAPRSPVSAEEQHWMQEIVAAGYRALAKMHHPDHGGRTCDMQSINAAAAKLRAGGSA